MAGIYTPELLPGVSEWESNQGSMIIVLDATKLLGNDSGSFFPMEHWIRQAKALGPIADLQTVAEFPGGDQARIWTVCLV